MDLPQTILLIIILIVATILVIIGIQIIGLLKDAKETLRKTDLILEDVSFLSRSLTRGTGALSHMMTSLESGVQIVGMISKLVIPKLTKK